MNKTANSGLLIICWGTIKKENAWVRKKCGLFLGIH